MPVNSEPVYYQLLSEQFDGTLIALSAPPGPNPGGDLVNATPDDTSERQLWELVVSLLSGPQGDDGPRFAMRNKFTGFVAAAPVGDNTWGVTQEGFGLGDPALLWTFAPADRFGLGDASGWPPKPKSQRQRGDWQRSRHWGRGAGARMASCGRSAVNELFRYTG